MPERFFHDTDILTLARVLCSRSPRAEYDELDFVDQHGLSIMDSESADRQGPSSGPSWNQVCSWKSNLYDDILHFSANKHKMACRDGD